MTKQQIPVARLDVRTSNIGLIAALVVGYLLGRSDKRKEVETYVVKEVVAGSDETSK